MRATPKYAGLGAMIARFDVEEKTERLVIVLISEMLRLIAVTLVLSNR